MKEMIWENAYYMRKSFTERKKYKNLHIFLVDFQWKLEESVFKFIYQNTF